MLVPSRQKNRDASWNVSTSAKLTNGHAKRSVLASQSCEAKDAELIEALIRAWAHGKCENSPAYDMGWTSRSRIAG
ncbi:unnamed protein product [Cylicocyclus nassatus]|uniref:Uncharacterized protein n=1 Tax=Cylicocyclus nassatus TaxID=53992 RepID=A0AA36M3N6_CYLNA|nr:unnamed protein product [Cylicocyclus nassatus]